MLEGAHAEIEGDEATQISDLAYDNRKAGPGTLFFCVPGATADGHDFAPAAVEAGASALVVERRLGLGRRRGAGRRCAGGDGARRGAVQR